MPDGSSNYGSGRKDDTGKLRYDLIPVHPLEELARVYTLGAAKYEDRNWEKGLSWARVFAAMMRHAWAWWRGETYDPTDGQHHLSSVAWCAFALMDYQRRGTGVDDRAPTYPPQAVINQQVANDRRVPRPLSTPAAVGQAVPAPVRVAWGHENPGDEA
jgi:hypothetical protein